VLLAGFKTKGKKSAAVDYDGSMAAATTCSHKIEEKKF
jgi:hypothetical protein